MNNIQLKCVVAPVAFQACHNMTSSNQSPVNSRYLAIDVGHTCRKRCQHVCDTSSDTGGVSQPNNTLPHTGGMSQATNALLQTGGVSQTSNAPHHTGGVSQPSNTLLHTGGVSQASNALPHSGGVSLASNALTYLAQVSNITFTVKAIYIQLVLVTICCSSVMKHLTCI